MRILGLSFGFHDSAAALVVDGIPVAAAQQERFSRIKNDSAFPTDAINYCLSVANVSANDLDLIAYHELPLLKFDRIVRSWIQGYPTTDQEFSQTVARWLQSNRLEVQSLIALKIGIDRTQVRFCRHHISHAASAYFASPFEKAAIVTIDGVGEYETAMLAIGEGGKIEPIETAALPHSLGLFYSAFTAYLGFTVNEGEYKVMGMAAFGRPIYAAELIELFEVGGSSLLNLKQNYFKFDGMSSIPYTKQLVERFGPPRVVGSPFGVASQTSTEEQTGPISDEVLSQSRHYANIAASVQLATEEIILRIVDRAVALTGLRQVVMSGGVALNSLANGRLIRERNIDLFVQPAAGDAGCALGAAFHAAHTNTPSPTRWIQTHSSFGRQFNTEAAVEAALASGYSIIHDHNSIDDYVSVVSRLLAQGSVFGWFEGRSEWGPRALGHRSILADPRRKEMQAVVNEKVKFREPFRPFAPAVPIEMAARYFDIGDMQSEFRRSMCAPETFMLAVHPVKPEYRDIIPAVTHADGSARVQFVHESASPVFHRLLSAFGALTGLPILLNTSFNLNGEPIVDSPEDAVRTFSLSGLDYLCLEGIIISKTLKTSL